MKLGDSLRASEDRLATLFTNSMREVTSSIDRLADRQTHVENAVTDNSEKIDSLAEKQDAFEKSQKATNEELWKRIQEFSAEVQNLRQSTDAGSGHGE
eukprot:10059657-Lingulodinium_polyedra.AAC.1